jgi:hypothetical protein
MSNGWTSERRARQAALILNWKPWEGSCGPKTERGKAVSGVLTVVAALCVIALGACSGSDDGSEEPHRYHAGPYIGGGAGVGF